MRSSVEFTISAFSIQKTVDDRVLVSLPENSIFPRWTLWLNRRNMCPIKSKSVKFKVSVPDTFNFVIKDSFYDGEKWVTKSESTISAITLAEQFRIGDSYG